MVFLTGVSASANHMYYCCEVTKTPQGKFAPQEHGIMVMGDNFTDDELFMYIEGLENGLEDYLGFPNRVAPAAISFRFSAGHQGSVKMTIKKDQVIQIDDFFCGGASNQTSYHLTSFTMGHRRPTLNKLLACSKNLYEDFAKML